MHISNHLCQKSVIAACVLSIPSPSTPPTLKYTKNVFPLPQTIVTLTGEKIPKNRQEHGIESSPKLNTSSTFPLSHCILPRESLLDKIDVTSVLTISDSTADVITQGTATTNRYAHGADLILHLEVHERLDVGPPGEHLYGC